LSWVSVRRRAPLVDAAELGDCLPQPRQLVAGHQRAHDPLGRHAPELQGSEQAQDVVPVLHEELGL
jgi:hypothetical protein